MALEYTWDQDFYYLTITIPIEEDIKKKDVNVDFSFKYLKIQVKDKVLEGELYNNIAVDESSWYFKEGKEGKNLIIELGQRSTKDYDGLTAKCFIFENDVYGDRKGCGMTSRNLNECSTEFQMEMMKKYEEGISQKFGTK